MLSVNYTVSAFLTLSDVRYGASSSADLASMPCDDILAQPIGKKQVWGTGPDVKQDTCCEAIEQIFFSFFSVQKWSICRCSEKLWLCI